MQIMNIRLDLYVLVLIFFVNEWAQLQSPSMAFVIHFPCFSLVIHALSGMEQSNYVFTTVIITITRQQ